MARFIKYMNFTGKNVLIINSSSEENRPLVDLFGELGRRNYSFMSASCSGGLLSQFKKNNWLTQKIFLGPNLKNFFNQIIFLILLPLLYLLYFICFSYLKERKKITHIICLAANEKIITTPLARLLKIRTVWIEDNPLFIEKTMKLLLIIYRLYSRWADIIIFNSSNKPRLKNLGIKEARIKTIAPAIKLSQRAYQDNLFLELARRGGKNFKHKFFTIGTIAELNRNKNLELLFSVIKNCLIIIPNIQLIVVYEGGDKKDLEWLVKKTEIDNVTWLVNRGQYVKKWLESFDVFVVTNEIIKLLDANIVLRAMEMEIPILGTQNRGLEDILPEISREKIGIFEDGGSEILTRRIIKLWRDKRLRKELGLVERKRVEKYFSLEKQAEEFEKMLT